MSTSLSPLLMVTDRRWGNVKSHSTRPPMTPRMGGRSFRGSQRKWAFTIARNLVGVLRPGSSEAAGRHGQHDRVGGCKRDALLAEVQFADAVRRAAKSAQLVTEADIATPALQQPDCRLDQHRTQALACNQGPASLPAGEQRLSDHGAGKTSRSLRRIDIEGRQQQWLHQPPIEWPLAGDGIADTSFGRGPDQRHQCQIVTQRSIWDATCRIENP